MEVLEIVGELLRMLWRRFLIFILVATAGTVGSVYYALEQPALYETTTLIQIQSPPVSEELARSTVSSPVSERLQVIEQRLMARNNVIEVIDELGLFSELVQESMNQRVDMLRESTRIERIAGAGQAWGSNVGPSALLITVRLGDPDLAAATANEFANRVLEQNQQTRVEWSRKTLDFFEEEERRVGDEIVQLEAEIAAFKNKNLDSLPEGLGFRRDEIARLQGNELEIDRRILELELERNALETDRSVLSTDSGTRSPEYEELRQLEVQLAQRRLVLAPTHPEIRQLEARIAAVESGSREIRDTAVERDIARLNSQVDALLEQKALIAERREVLEESVRNMPEVALALNTLDRRLQQLQDQYSVISVRRAEAETGQRLEANRQSERFEILESALVPDWPVEPSRKRIVLMGTFASLCLAFGLIWMLDFLNPIIRTSGQMKRKLDLHPVITIPYIPTTWERRRQQLKWVVGIAIVAISLPFAIEFVDSNVMPLEGLAEQAGIDGLLRGAGVNFTEPG